MRVKSYKIAGNAYFDADEAQAEIDALKAQNADLLAALTESLAYVEATLSNHDAGCQRHPSTEHARDCILSDLDQIKTAIAKARGESCNTF